MAYDFLNSTTYSNDPLAQGDFSAFLPSEESTPLGAGFDTTSFDSDLIEIVAGQQQDNSESEQPDLTSFVQENDLPEDPNPQVDMELLNSMFEQEPEAAPRAKSYTAPPSNDDDEDDTPAPTPAPSGRRVTRTAPRIWQYGGHVPKYQVIGVNAAADINDIQNTATRQFGGDGTLYAETYEQQRIGLNNPNYNTAVFNTKGTNTFRGLDNHQPVAITDGKKYQVLYGPKDTAKFSGKVYEQKMQMGGEVDTPLTKQDEYDVKSFYNDYLNSTNYTKRLTEQGYADPHQAVLDRLANIKGVTHFTDDLLGSMYDAPNYSVVVNSKDAKEFGFPLRSVLAHEYGHTIGASQGKYLTNPNLELNQNEMNAFLTRNKLSKVNTAGMTEQQKLDVEHDSRPSESSADLNALRYRLFKDLKFNTGTQELTPELLKQAKELYKNDNIVNRLFQNYSDEDLIYLMNHVAYNNTNNRPIYG